MFQYFLHERIHSIFIKENRHGLKVSYFFYRFLDFFTNLENCPVKSKIKGSIEKTVCEDFTCIWGYSPARVEKPKRVLRSLNIFL